MSEVAEVETASRIRTFAVGFIVHIRQIKQCEMRVHLTFFASFTISMLTSTFSFLSSITRLVERENCITEGGGGMLVHVCAGEGVI